MCAAPASTPASITNTFADLFMDPISFELMVDPVIDPCGHTFERVQIEGWLSINAVCPLSRRPMTVANLLSNLIVKDALEALAHAPPIISGKATIKDLSDEDQKIVQLAMDALYLQRENDRKNQIPDRLPSPQSFFTKVSNKSSKSSCDC